MLKCSHGGVAIHRKRHVKVKYTCMYHNVPSCLSAGSVG